MEIIDQLNTLRKIRTGLCEFEELLDGLLMLNRATVGQADRLRLCLDALVRARRHVGHLTAEVVLDVASDYEKREEAQRERQPQEV